MANGRLSPATMHRFLIEPERMNGDLAPLNEAETRHALRVLRLVSGASVQALDGCGNAWQGELVTDGETAAVRLLAPCDSTEAPVNVTLYMGIPKGEKLELIAQKLTELGAMRLVPVRMERCVAKIAAQEAEKKLSRIRRIAQEAQKQSGRRRELEITDPVDLPEVCRQLSTYDKTFLLWEEARGFRLTDGCEEAPGAENIAYIVGPEGGISHKEADLLMQAGACPVTMGPRILRAETAAVAGCAAILTLWGDL